MTASEIGEVEVEGEKSGRCGQRFRPAVAGRPGPGARVAAAVMDRGGGKLYHFFTFCLPNSHFVGGQVAEGGKLHQVGTAVLQAVEGQGADGVKHCFWCRNNAETVQFFGRGAILRISLLGDEKIVVGVAEPWTMGLRAARQLLYPYS